MPVLYTYRLFISHAWSYSESYNRIITFLDAAGNFKYANYSIPVDRAFLGMTKEQLKEQLRQQIRPVEVVVVLAGMYVAHSDWIQFEIDFAKQLTKPILGVRPWGAERTPVAVSDAADEMVGWNTDAIVNAIRRLA